MRRSEQDDYGAKAQGRPPGGTREQGRERLIEKARDAMRSPPRSDIQRREIAEHAGVTPALVSYYFPDRTDLLELAAQPIVDLFTADIEAVLGSADAPDRKLERLIVTLLAFHSEQGSILDHFVQISLAKSKDGNIDGLRTLEGRLTVFFDELVANGIIRDVDRSLALTALWGLCRDIGRRQPGDVFHVDPGLADDPRALARHILGLFGGPGVAGSADAT